MEKVPIKPLRKFGLLTFIYEDDPHIRSNGRKRRRLFCKCDCGGEGSYQLDHLRSGHTQSCGCLWDKAMTTHGKYHTRAYTSWRTMLDRCTNPKMPCAKHYIGRGIKVCQRWRDFENFYRDMGERPLGKSLDRINNDGDYRPDNCRWATQKQQMNNIRTNKRLVFNGIEKTISDWAEELGLTKSCITNRLSSGRTVYEALSSPMKHYRPRK